MYFVVTIDTEEDQWTDYSRAGFTLANMGRIRGLQAMFDAHGVRPCYLVTYPVASDEKAVGVLREIQERGACEIGAHCHPWNTPPFEEEISPANTMLYRLPSHLQLRKLETLTRQIETAFGTRTTSFRAGRWGFDSQVARHLLSLGYEVDTSVTPLVDWRMYLGPDFRRAPGIPYRFHPDEPLVPEPEGTLLEVPATVGLSRRPFALWRGVFNLMDRSGPLRKVLVGGSSRLGLLARMGLSPELGDAAEMIALIRLLEAEGVSTLNLTFHSNSLLEGNTPFVRNEAEAAAFLEELEKVVIYAKERGMEFVTLRDLSGTLAARV